MPPAPPGPSRTRLSISLGFLVHGVVAGTFASRVNWAEQHLGVTAGAFSVAFTCQAIGSLLAMSMATRLVHRFGVRGALRLSLPLWCAALPLPMLMPNLALFSATMLAVGVVLGVSIVSTNAMGVVVERHLGRSVMTGLHGLWSVGTLTGAGIGTLATWAGLDARIHMTAVALVIVPLAWISGRDLPAGREDATPDSPRRFAMPPRSVVAIGLVGLCSAFVEGASMNWSAIYLGDVTQASDAVATAGYACYVGAMSLSRMLGDLLVTRVGPGGTVRIGASLAGTGGVLVVLAPSPAVAIGGFVLIGFGSALTVPLAAAAGGRVGPSPARGVAGVMTFTSLAGLIGPSVIGRVGDLGTLRASFAVVTVVTVAVAVFATVLDRGRAPTAAEFTTAA
ncbi:MFS transporter [Actinorhabdospora filicis]|uniref:MFS transporter n=1 Tax=Actinorhabdospora filicis TaxID=1785913 RepID=A0A9W6SHC7_9ACTN|nr:MFS transporter [Actinorhabdospora filicis]GLZ76018.1 MFS transporter [Actinorhabdospora filicis]